MLRRSLWSGRCHWKIKRKRSQRGAWRLTPSSCLLVPNSKRKRRVSIWRCSFVNYRKINSETSLCFFTKKKSFLRGTSLSVGRNKKQRKSRKETARIFWWYTNEPSFFETVSINSKEVIQTWIRLAGCWRCIWKSKRGNMWIRRSDCFKKKFRGKGRDWRSFDDFNQSRIEIRYKFRRGAS